MDTRQKASEFAKKATNRISPPYTQKVLSCYYIDKGEMLPVFLSLWRLQENAPSYQHLHNTAAMPNSIHLWMDLKCKNNWARESIVKRIKYIVHSSKFKVVVIEVWNIFKHVQFVCEKLNNFNPARKKLGNTWLSLHRDINITWSLSRKQSKIYYEISGIYNSWDKEQMFTKLSKNKIMQVHSLHAIIT